MKYLLLVLLSGCYIGASSVRYVCGKIDTFLSLNQPDRPNRFLCPNGTHLTGVKDDATWEAACECDKP